MQITLKKTDSNISWSASNIQIYPNSNGKISGIVGRYSGQLVLNFKGILKIELVR